MRRPPLHDHDEILGKRCRQVLSKNVKFIPGSMCYAIFIIYGWLIRKKLQN
jgi:hypothetical protein